MFMGCCELLTRSVRTARSAPEPNRSRCPEFACSVCSAVSDRARSPSPRATASTIAPCSAQYATGSGGPSTAYIQAIFCLSWVGIDVGAGLPEAWASVSWNQPPSERRSSLLP
ncbi:hypothetical protein GA0115245_13085 [Streptomyces sp. di188]|nr:hypothetical protein GA0115238_14105 [Streptomyces sp. di50b]SCE32552.1 hypothetical protein GA0115245_13085 [Streptomyces sp. di188]